MRRLRCALTAALVGFAYLLRVAAAQAESSVQPPAPPSAAVAPSAAVPPSQAVAPSEAVPPSGAVLPAPQRLEGFELLASVGYGVATTKILDLELQPNGTSFGLDVGYTFRPGFRVGGVVGYGLGRTIKQHHEAAVGDDFDFAADSSTLNIASSLGWDVPLFFLVLRYTVNLGVTVMWWDFGGVPPKLIFRNIAATSPTVGVFVAPGLTLLWRHDLLQCGLGFDYIVQSNGAIPPSFLGELLVGVKL
jgi:hypothetical protein